MPRAGLYGQRITIYGKNVTGQNSFGEDVLGAPIEIAATWASVEYLQGRERERAMQKWADARYQIKMRWQPVEIMREHWVEWNDHSLDILDIQGPGTREKSWTIIAKDHVE